MKFVPETPEEESIASVLNLAPGAPFALNDKLSVYKTPIGNGFSFLMGIRTFNPMKDIPENAQAINAIAMTGRSDYGGIDCLGLWDKTTQELFVINSYTLYEALESDKYLQLDNALGQEVLALKERIAERANEILNEPERSAELVAYWKENCPDRRYCSDPEPTVRKEELEKLYVEDKTSKDFAEPITYEFDLDRHLDLHVSDFIWSRVVDNPEQWINEKANELIEENKQSIGGHLAKAEVIKNKLAVFERNPSRRAWAARLLRGALINQLNYDVCSPTRPDIAAKTFRVEAIIHAHPVAFKIESNDLVNHIAQPSGISTYDIHPKENRESTKAASGIMLNTDMALDIPWEAVPLDCISKISYGKTTIYEMNDDEKAARLNTQEMRIDIFRPANSQAVDDLAPSERYLDDYEPFAESIWVNVPTWGPDGTNPNVVVSEVLKQLSSDYDLGYLQQEGDLLCIGNAAVVLGKGTKLIEPRFNADEMRYYTRSFGSAIDNAQSVNDSLDSSEPARGKDER